MTARRVAIVMALHDEPRPEALVALAAQTAPREAMEVVLVDGFHHEPTWRAAIRVAEEVRDRIEVRAIRIPRAGRGTCWNRGVAETTAPVVLFLADDFLASPGLVEEHLRLHDTRPEMTVVGIGPAFFPDHLRRSWFRRWIEDSGRLFGVSFTRPDPELLRGFFYGANTSIKRSLLERLGGFDERFVGHAVEDFELGIRLAANGAKLVFLPAARAEHLHPFSLRVRAAALREAGASLRLVEGLHPRLDAWRPVVEASPWRHVRSVALRRVASTLLPTKPLRARTYRAVLDRALARGYRAASDVGAHADPRGSETPPV